ncbi:MAG: hypothetical protein OXI87_10570 [Albidovulum sp.]|nr:hypothetical protein [Albidovulum sp.]MDE0305310.1 hypothetical protein [Albidovulum sp.]MDE0530986.1 hypothetical protein [Albidovulum sp.]
MKRLFVAIGIVVAIAAAGITGYAFLGDMTPLDEKVVVPIKIDAN